MQLMKKTILQIYLIRSLVRRFDAPKNKFIKPPAGLTQTAVAFVEKRRKPRPALRSLIICKCFTQSKRKCFTQSKQTRSAQTKLAYKAVKQNNACSLREGRLFKLKIYTLCHRRKILFFKIFEGI